MSKRPKGHGCAAFAPSDVEDAERGYPSASLEGYAAERALEYHGRGSLAGFRMALPRFQEYEHNLMRGVLPGGRWGVLFHELVQTHGAGESMPGTFYGVRTSSPGKWGRGGGDAEPSEAFAIPGAWAPATTVATAVPETVAAFGEMRFAQKNRTPLVGGGPRELCKGWRAYFADPPDAGAVERLVSGRIPEVLQEALALPYAEVRVDYGMLRVRRSGYVLDASALDALSISTCELAGALADAALDGYHPTAFSDALPPCPWAQDDGGVTEPGIAGAWAADFREFAARHDLVLEDTMAWHQAFPTQPIPGHAVAVMRGELGASGLTGRLLFATDIPVPRTRAVRGALALTAAPGVADSPPGGLHGDDPTIICNVRDGLATAWTRNTFGYCKEAEGFADAAIAALRSAGAIR